MDFSFYGYAHVWAVLRKSFYRTSFVQSYAHVWAVLSVSLTEKLETSSYARVGGVKCMINTMT